MKILFLLFIFPFMFHPSHWFATKDYESLMNILLVWSRLFSSEQLNWNHYHTSILEQLGKLNDIKIFWVCTVLMRHVINTKLLLLLLLITIKISVSKPSDVINEYFRKLLIGFLEGDDGNRFLSMEIFWAKAFNHIVLYNDGIGLKSWIPCICTIGEGLWRFPQTKFSIPRMRIHRI